MSNENVSNQKSDEDLVREFLASGGAVRTIRKGRNSKFRVRDWKAVERGDSDKLVGKDRK